jgi:hypothetical protein
MGLILVIIGIVLLILGYFLIGLILVVVGILLLFAPWPGAYGYSYYRGRRGPP